jgi:hypothetical protein
MPSQGALIGDALLCVAMACFTACQQNAQNAFVAHGPLPPPPTGEIKHAGASTANPFTKQEGNYFARTAFETDGPGNSHIEIRDVLFPPHTKGTVAALPGPGIMSPATGKATFGIGERAEMTAAESVRSLPAGQALQFENSDSRPATIRLYVIRAR